MGRGVVFAFAAVVMRIDEEDAAVVELNEVAFAVARVVGAGGEDGRCGDGIWGGIVAEGAGWKEED
jgi:hypothetical protein